MKRIKKWFFNFIVRVLGDRLLDYVHSYITDEQGKFSDTYIRLAHSLRYQTSEWSMGLNIHNLGILYHTTKFGFYVEHGMKGFCIVDLNHNAEGLTIDNTIALSESEKMHLHLTLSSNVMKEAMPILRNFDFKADIAYGSGSPRRFFSDRAIRACFINPTIEEIEAWF